MGAADKDWQSAEEETLGVGEDVEGWRGGSTLQACLLTGKIIGEGGRSLTASPLGRCPPVPTERAEPRVSPPAERRTQMELHNVMESSPG